MGLALVRLFTLQEYAVARRTSRRNAAAMVTVPEELVLTQRALLPELVSALPQHCHHAALMKTVPEEFAMVRMTSRLEPASAKRIYRIMNAVLMKSVWEESVLALQNSRPEHAYALQSEDSQHAALMDNVCWGLASVLRQLPQGIVNALSKIFHHAVLIQTAQEELAMVIINMCQELVNVSPTLCQSAAAIWIVAGYLEHALVKQPSRQEPASFARILPWE
jgi:hypothetical protein